MCNKNGFEKAYDDAHELLLKKSRSQVTRRYQSVKSFHFMLKVLHTI
jgi:hypothetical protein